MPATTNVNERSVIHAQSGGVASAFPDTCSTPSPAGPVPVPYPNVALSTDTAKGSREVAVDGNPVMLEGSCFALSSGDEAGSLGGVVSGCVKGRAELVLYSFDVKFEGKGVGRLGDLMLQNIGAGPNTAPFPLIQPPCPSTGGESAG
jgi:hypothetical protein